MDRIWHGPGGITVAERWEDVVHVDLTNAALSVRVIKLDRTATGLEPTQGRGGAYHRDLDRVKELSESMEVEAECKT